MILLKKILKYKNRKKLKIIGEHLMNFQKSKKILNYRTDILQPDSNLIQLINYKLFNKSKKISIFYIIGLFLLVCYQTFIWLVHLKI